MYAHLPQLAPTTELRQLQYAEDDRLGEGKRSRTTLAPAYVARFTREILDEANLDAVVEIMPGDAATALLCVEQQPGACHRSLVAAELADRYAFEVVHITPPARG
jgi:hypothetical protein